MPKTQRDPTLQVVGDDHARGASDAPATILVYGDYECPYTRELEMALAQLRKREANLFRSVFRYFPLREIHPHAQMAAEAAEAVYAMGGADAFWVMHDGLFANQDDLAPSGLLRRGAEAGIDPKALRAALEARQFVDRIERDVRSGIANDVNGTPSVFIDGERYMGPRDVASLREVLTP